MTLEDYFQKMQAYETWATSLTLDSIETVPDRARGGVQHTRALQVMAHVQIARSVWLARIEGRNEKPADWFPAWTVAETRTKAAELDRGWQKLLASNPDFSRAVRYTSSEGVGYESTLGEVLAHVFNHSTYHRGQVARLVNEAGGKRATTDMIAMTRRTA